jgi:hypothetical protein
MTPEQINIAIAEHYGFNLEDFRMEEGGINVAALPDYCNDLNSMHSAEMKLTNTDDYVRFSSYLYEIAQEHSKKTGIWCWLSSTARQRAEAFLKAVEKWEES